MTELANNALHKWLGEKNVYNIARRARLIALISGLIAVIAIGVSLIAVLGFAQSFTRLQQLSLLLAAVILCP